LRNCGAGPRVAPLHAVCAGQGQFNKESTVFIVILLDILGKRWY
jgi:hypothetical protein